MREAAPLFTREPHARPGPPGTQLQLTAATADPDADPVANVTDDSLHPPTPSPDPDREAEHCGQQIVWRLQARAHAERGSELDPAELATALEATTTLPAEVISRLAHARSEEQVAVGAERARAADLDRAARMAADGSGSGRAEDLRAARRESRIADTSGAHTLADRSAAQLAAESFPCTAADGIRAAANGGLQPPARPPAPAAAVHSVRRPGLSA